jgi:serine/threonine protein kinase
VAERAQLHSDLEALVGKLVHDRYRVDSLLGVGGMGAVFKGFHTGLKRDVAIKLLHPEIGRDESVSKRFDREAYSASRLDHPNCVRVSDFGTTESGAKYLVMEFLVGAELKDSLGKPWAPLDAVRVALQIFAGLEHAHHFGVVHRDLKPENVFVTSDYRGQQLVKLVDFGIAKLIDGEGTQEKLTRQGLVFGTPRYMSPEQAAGGKIDERTDLYAAGLILYEMLSGQAPFDAEEPGQLLRMHIMAPPPPLPSGLPARLVKLVDKLLEKSKGDRPANAREVFDELQALERELVAAPVAAVVPVSPAVPTSAPAVVPASRTSWQPAEPTSSIPAPPPPAAAPSSPGLADVQPMPPPLPGPPIPTAAIVPPPLAATPPSPVTASRSVTVPMTPNATVPMATPSQSWPTVSSSHTWAATGSSASASRPNEKKPMLPWIIAAAAIFAALIAVAALLAGSSEEPVDEATPAATTPSKAGEPPRFKLVEEREDDEDADEREGKGGGKGKSKKHKD